MCMLLLVVISATMTTIIQRNHVRHFRFRQRNHLPIRFRWFRETGFSFANRMQKTAESETGFGYIWVNMKPVSHNRMRS